MFSIFPTRYSDNLDDRTRGQRRSKFVFFFSWPYLCEQSQPARPHYPRNALSTVVLSFSMKKRCSFRMELLRWFLVSPSRLGWITKELLLGMSLVPSRARVLFLEFLPSARHSTLRQVERLHLAGYAYFAKYVSKYSPSPVLFFVRLFRDPSTRISLFRSYFHFIAKV